MRIGNPSQRARFATSFAISAALVGCHRGALDAGWNRAEEEPIAPDAPRPQPDPPPPDPVRVDAAVPIARDAGSAAPPEPAPSSNPDAGATGPLPVSARNAVIVSNDGTFDNWQGEYALLFAQAGGPRVAGIVVGIGRTWPDLATNLSGWQELVTRARDSGLTGVPDPIGSNSVPLQRPADGEIDSTLPNDSAGARFIVEKSLELAEPDLPVVVATGGSLTDVADAYLLDPTVAERVVVVASLGTGFADADPVAQMGVPNGEMDTWAGAIVVERFRYVQVSAFYEHGEDVPEARIAELPDNPFGDWMRDKRAEIWPNPMAADQVSVLALALPEFAVSVERASPSGLADDQPTLTRDPEGTAWIVTASDGAVASASLWQLLSDPSTFAPDL